MTGRFVPSMLTVLALVWFASLASEAQQLRSPEFGAWRATMKQSPLPYKGCFKASYPATEWQEVTCTTAPNRPYLPAEGGRSKPNTVGNGTDYTGVVTSGLLSQAEGAFPIVSNVTSANTYSLQLNANFFTTSVCTPGCSGWQQFVYSESPSQLFMQYWLINYGTSCPSGWTLYGTSDCYKNSSATNIASQPITNLPYITLTGKALGGTDTALMDTPNGDISAVGQDSVLNLEQGWNSAEFNVFGNCCGNEVDLNLGASLIVQINLTNGTTNTPTYYTEGFTGETNNLTLTGNACPYGGTNPMIQFLESSARVSDESCGASGIQSVMFYPTQATFIGKPSEGLVYQTVTLTNATSSTLTITNVTISGPFQWKGCPGTLPPDSSCISGVGFNFDGHAANQHYTGSLTMTTSDGTESIGLSAYVK
jgi:hypothetical protein